MTNKNEPEAIPAPGTAAEGWPKVRTTIRPDGRVAVDGLPGVRVSNPNFLTDEFERYRREKEAENESAGGPRP